MFNQKILFRPHTRDEFNYAGLEKTKMTMLVF